METTAGVADDGGTAGIGDLKEQLGDKVADTVAAVRGKTGNMQAGLADLLDSSARAIRARGVSAAETAGGTVGDGAAERLVDGGEATAEILERGAMWLRENDLSDVEARVTDQLQRHPARTLLMAAGIGFFLSRRR
jgi:hypothetical protein